MRPLFHHKYLQLKHLFRLKNWVVVNDLVHLRVNFKIMLCIMLADLKKPLSLEHLLYQHRRETLQVKHLTLSMIMLLALISQSRIKYS